MPEQLLVGVDHIRVGRHRIGVEAATVTRDHGLRASSLQLDPRDLGVQLQPAAQILEQPDHPLHQRPGAAAGKPDTALALQGMDQRVDGRGLERIAAHQQRVKGQRLAQPVVLHELGHHAVHVAPGLQLGQLRRDADHAAKRQEGHGAELDVALLVHRPRIGEKALIAGHVTRVERVDLPVQLGLVVDVVEAVAVLPAQPVEGADRQQLDIVGHALAGAAEEFFQRRRIGDHRRPGVEGEALVAVDVGAAARLVALLQQRRLDAGTLQADRQRQPAETGTDHHRPPHTACCLVHRLSLCRLLAASARSASPTGTGGLPETMRKRSQAVSSAA